MSQETASITIPEEEEWVALLKQMQKNLQDRIKRTYDNNQETRTSQIDYAFYILSRLLDSGLVSAHAIYLELAEPAGEKFNKSNFDNALSLIIRYASDIDDLKRNLP